MKFNEIIKNDVNQNHIPLTKKYNSNDNFRNWDPFQSSLSAAILCGLEIIPINNTSSLLYIGPLQPSESLNLLDLVENNRKIFYLTKIKAQFPK